MKAMTNIRNIVLAAAFPLATAASGAVAQAPQAPVGPPSTPQSNPIDLQQLNRTTGGVSTNLVNDAEPGLRSYQQASREYAKAINDGKKQVYLFSAAAEQDGSVVDVNADQRFALDHVLTEQVLHDVQALGAANAARTGATDANGQRQNQEEMPSAFDCRHPHLAHLDAISGKRDSTVSRLEAPVDAVEGLVKGGYGLGMLAELAVLIGALTQIPRGRFWATALSGTFGVTVGAAAIGAVAHGSADVITPPIKRWIEVDDRLARCNVLGAQQAETPSYTPYTVQIPKPDARVAASTTVPALSTGLE